ncbi:hypothetical protein Pfra02_39980 [Pseudomonas fragi]|nr:hypothetical protein Pfra02_39980 [Pseudomonas fragi]
MCRAFNQAGTFIKELIGLPFQPDVAVWAAIFIGVDLPFATDDKKVQLRRVDAAAATLAQFV